MEETRRRGDQWRPARIGIGHSAALTCPFTLIGHFVLWFIVAVVVLLAVPAILGLCARGDPDHAVRHESSEQPEDGVKQR